MNQDLDLPTILLAGSCLVDSTQSQASNLKAVLISRLSAYYARIGAPECVHGSDTLEQVQLETAQAALQVVERVQQILDMDESAGENHCGGPPLTIGTRDLTLLRTLISILFKWSVEPLFVRATSEWLDSLPSNTPPGPTIVDSTALQQDYQLLSSVATRLVALLLPRGAQGSFPQTHITTTILNRHLTDVLRPCITLGWLPKSIASNSKPTLHSVRPFVIRLLTTLPPAQTIAALGTIISGFPSCPRHVRKTCAVLLSKQLLRPEGVRGLFAAIFGEESVSDDDAPLEKLEHVARVLTTVPGGMKPDEYFELIIPRILALFVNTAPTTYRRAAAFAISRLLASDGSFHHHDLVVNIILPILHDPFFHITGVSLNPSIPAGPSSTPLAPLRIQHPTPTSSLSILILLLTNIDPSPTLISSLLSPIVAELYSLLACLDRTKTSDPGLKESVRDILSTWGRVVEAQEGTDTLWPIVTGNGGEWDVDVAGEVKRVEKHEQPSRLVLFTPEDLRRADEAGELDVDSNLLSLRPDPVHFIHFLKLIDRGEISSDLFVRLLEGYRETKVLPDIDPMRTVLYLQLIIQMQSQLADGNAPASILSKPEHILSFVKHALESAATSFHKEGRVPEAKADKGLKMEDLRIVTEEDRSSSEADSDDEMPESWTMSPDDEMTDTAINLLLSILEANPDLSARTVPVLNDIFSLLEPLANELGHLARPSAREAMMVMTARLASTSAPQSSRSLQNADEKSVQETYQKALKLLQDPILPVRVHGLLLLRQLVSPQPNQPSSVDPALVPAILSIFLQSIQDDESYVFLNAVQGLVAMVNAFGKDVLKGLVKIYTQGLEGLSGTDLTEHDVNMRVRVGEALAQVIRRCGDALGSYVDILVPPIFSIVRASHIPTTLRTSALSLLAECESTSPLALLSYTFDLSEAMIDLLQVESVPALHRQAISRPREDDLKEEPAATMDNQPTSTNSKFPPLRRAGLHFLSLLLRASTAQAYDSRFQIRAFPGASEKRARTILAYVASTDADDVVRVMAKEVMEELENLNKAILGVKSFIN